MMDNRHLARNIGDEGWGELRSKLFYKASDPGVDIGVVARFFASPKTCSLAVVAVNG